MTGVQMQVLGGGGAGERARGAARGGAEPQGRPHELPGLRPGAAGAGGRRAGPPARAGQRTAQCGRCVTLECAWCAGDSLLAA